MIYAGIIDRPTTMIFDGFSNARTESEAIKDMGKLVARFDRGEGEEIMRYTSELLLPAKESCGGFFLEVEPVPSAFKLDEETEEMTYKPAKWYVCCRICK